MNQSTYHSIIRKYPPRREYLISMMHEIQNADSYNHIPEEALKAMADYTKLSMSAVMGVVEYYSMFSSKPRGRFVVRVCISPVCINREAENIVNVLLNHYNLPELHSVSEDGLISIETSECLGRCHEGTTVSINDYYLEHVNAESVISQIDEYIKSRSND